jgi:hypothetical protein
MAPLSDPVECGTDISIARCRQLLGDEADLMTDRDIAMMRQQAESTACVLVEMYEEQRRTTE